MTDSSFGRGIKLGRVAGVEVSAHWSVAILVALLTALLAASELPAAVPGEPTAVYWLVGAGTAALFFVSLAGHELAHAVVARSYGMRVKRLTLWMLGGVTELDGEPPSPGADAWIAASGPVATIVFGGIAAGLAAVVGVDNIFGAALAWLAAISFLLAVFNLLPGAPLDGGRLVRAIVWRRTGDQARATIAAANVGRVLGYVFVGLGLLLVFAGDPGGLWLALVGWFVIAGASGEQFAVRAGQLAGLTAADVMVPDPLVAAHWWTAQHLLTLIDPRRSAQPIFPLADVEGRAVGAVALGDLERAIRTGRGETRLDELRPRVPYPLVTTDAPLADVLPKIHVRGHAAVVVDDRNRPVGIVDEFSLIQAMRLAQLGRPAAGAVSLTKAGAP
ncbi:MAG TPA: site-2 protease family protein [Jatrophihabitans sp.]|nr:site-2 protease family protein [Jatrophihabitans sp.]